MICRGVHARAERTTEGAASACHPGRRSAPRGDVQRAHLPAGRSRWRRRRRHERLHRRDREAAGRASGSPSRSSPGPPPASSRPPSNSRPGVLVRHVTAGPFEGLAKNDLPAQLCAFTAGVLRTEAFHEPGWYDVVHSHYWLSGQVGWLARERWGVPLVHSAAHAGEGQERAAGRRGPPRAAGPIDRRGPGRGRGGPADRLHRGGSRPAGRALRRPARAGAYRRARRRPRHLHAGGPAGGAAPARAAPGRRRPCCSWAGSSR